MSIIKKVSVKLNAQINVRSREGLKFAVLYEGLVIALFDRQSNAEDFAQSFPGYDLTICEVADDTE